MIARLRTWSSQHKALLAVLAVGLILRLLWVLVFNSDPTWYGGDAPFYMLMAESIVRGEGLRPNGMTVLTIGPIYPLFLSIFFAAFPHEQAIVAARLAEVIVSTGTIALVYWLAQHYYGRRAGLLAAGLIAIDLRFVVESGGLHTETVFVFVLMLCAVIYEHYRQDSNTRALIPVGIAIGVAGMTRAIAFAAPAVVVIHQLLVTRPLKRALTRLAWFAGAFILTISPLLLYNYAENGIFTLGEGWASNLWLGTQGEGQWEGQVDFVGAIEEIPREDSAQPLPTSDDYINDARNTILADPWHYVGLLATKLTRAYLQPAGTVHFPGASIKTEIQNWLAGDSSLGQVMQAPYIWPKLWMYLFHFGNIGLTIIGMWITRRHWRSWSFSMLMILYFSGAYTLLTIIPRYLFPIMPLYLILASGAIIHIASKWPVKKADHAQQSMTEEIPA